MTFHRFDWVYIVGAGLILLLIYSLPTPRDRNPRVPATPEHRNVRTTTTCLGCHAEGEAQQLPVPHPKRTDCFRCHRIDEPEAVEQTAITPGMEDLFSVLGRPTRPNRPAGSRGLMEEREDSVNALQRNARAGKDGLLSTGRGS